MPVTTWDFSTPDDHRATSIRTARDRVSYVMRGGISTPDTDYQDEFTPQNVNASFVALVNWDDAELFVVDMMGEHRQMGGQIARWNPEQHPTLAGLYCVGCKRLGNYGRMSRDPVRNSVEFEGVAYACTFAAFLYDVLEDEDILDPDTLQKDESLRYVERTRRNIGQSISTAGQFEYTTAPNLAIPTPPALMIPYSEFTYTWRYVPGPITDLEAACDQLYGTVNDDEFEGKAEGTCIYLGMEPEPIIATPALNRGVDRLYTIKHKVGFFKQGWNSVYRPNLGTPPGDWDTARNRTTGGPPYESSNFNVMFQI